MRARELLRRLHSSVQRIWDLKYWNFPYSLCFIFKYITNSKSKTARVGRLGGLNGSDAAVSFTKTYASRRKGIEIGIGETKRSWPIRSVDRQTRSLFRHDRIGGSTGRPKVRGIFDTPLFSGPGWQITKPFDVVIAETARFFLRYNTHW